MSVLEPWMSFHLKVRVLYSLWHGALELRIRGESEKGSGISITTHPDKIFENSYAICTFWTFSLQKCFYIYRPSSEVFGIMAPRKFWKVVCKPVHFTAFWLQKRLLRLHSLLLFPCLMLYACPHVLSINGDNRPSCSWQMTPLVLS